MHAYISILRFFPECSFRCFLPNFWMILCPVKRGILHIIPQKISLCCGKKIATQIKVAWGDAINIVNVNNNKDLCQNPLPPFPLPSFSLTPPAPSSLPTYITENHDLNAYFHNVRIWGEGKNTEKYLKKWNDHHQQFRGFKNWGKGGRGGSRGCSG